MKKHIIVIVIVILGSALFFVWSSKEHKQYVNNEGVVKNSEEGALNPGKDVVDQDIDQEKEITKKKSEIATNESITSDDEREVDKRGSDDGNNKEKEISVNEVQKTDQETNQETDQKNEKFKDIKNNTSSPADEAGTNDESPNSESSYSEDKPAEDEGSPASVVNSNTTSSSVDDKEIFPGRETYTLLTEEIEKSGMLLNKYVNGYREYHYEPDKYQALAKESTLKLVVFLEDKNGERYEGIFKTFELTDESILNVLSVYSNYFNNGKNIENLEYEFEVHISGEEYEDIDEGVVLVSNDKIYVLMAEDEPKLDHFLDIFNESTETEGTFQDYLRSSEGRDVLSDINKRYESQLRTIENYDQKVPQSVKDSGLAMWDAYLELEMGGLTKYYADKVWFYASYYEWFNESGESRAHHEGIYDYDEKEFFLLEKEKLLAAYKKEKTEEFQELLPLFKTIKKDITFYYIEDLMKLCGEEDPDEFYDFIKAQENDIVMFVEVGPGNNNICSLNGRFSFNNRFFWLLRDIDGKVQVVTDYNE